VTEDPRGRGYPNLGTPQTRVTQAWRHTWTRLLMDGPRNAKKALTVTQAARNTLKKRG
jgi:hypothetical protein